MGDAARLAASANQSCVLQMRPSNVQMQLEILAITISLPLFSGSSTKKPLPCGDYDGAPSHNDCAPVSLGKKAKCQKWTRPLIKS